MAAQCDSLADSLRLARLGRTERRMVAMPMGEVALPVRFLAMRERGGFVYAPVENATAPGQISLEEMKSMYRADSFGRRTGVYGVIGDPIGHSLSPQMQNAGFEARGSTPYICRFWFAIWGIFSARLRCWNPGLQRNDTAQGTHRAASRRLRSAGREDRGGEYGGGARRRKALRIQYGLRERAAGARTAHPAAGQPRAHRWRGGRGARCGVRAGGGGRRRLHLARGGTKRRNRLRGPSAEKRSRATDCGANSSMPS